MLHFRATTFCMMGQRADKTAALPDREGPPFIVQVPS
jgi:hypothetical protein